LLHIQEEQKLQVRVRSTISWQF